MGLKSLGKLQIIFGIITLMFWIFFLVRDTIFIEIPLLDVVLVKMDFLLLGIFAIATGYYFLKKV